MKENGGMMLSEHQTNMRTSNEKPSSSRTRTGRGKIEVGRENRSRERKREIGRPAEEAETS